MNLNEESTFIHFPSSLAMGMLSGKMVWTGYEVSQPMVGAAILWFALGLQLQNTV